MAMGEVVGVFGIRHWAQGGHRGPFYKCPELGKESDGLRHKTACELQAF
jgi:hypothetical protein